MAVLLFFVIITQVTESIGLAKIIETCTLMCMVKTMQQTTAYQVPDFDLAVLAA